MAEVSNGAVQPQVPRRGSQVNLEAALRLVVCQDEQHGRQHMCKPCSRYTKFRSLTTTRYRTAVVILNV